jgi:hypothetical protein
VHTQGSVIVGGRLGGVWKHKCARLDVCATAPYGSGGMASCDHYPRVPLPLPCSSLFLHESKEGERETNRRRRVLECSPMAESPQQRLRCCWQQVRQCGAFEIRCVEELLFGFQYEHHTVVKRAVVSIHCGQYPPPERCPKMVV